MRDVSVRAGRAHSLDMTELRFDTIPAISKATLYVIPTEVEESLAVVWP